MSYRSNVFLAARIVTDVHAARTRPKAVVKREAKRIARRQVNRTVSRVFRSVGLGS